MSRTEQNMQKIAQNVYVKTDSRGTNLGLVVTSQGPVLIDTPLIPRESREWLAQIQELTDLVHEWRTMNEAPEIHERIEQANLPQSVQEARVSIKGYNKRFDQTTRRAMQNLADGQSAERELVSARAYLLSLTDLFESLPAPKGVEATEQ